MTSLLASNLGSSYVKVGHPFTTYGWPMPYQRGTHQITSLAEIREKQRQGCVVGGHLFAGLEGLLGGRWDLWMNARNPVDRVSSGILRFHSKAMRAANGEEDLMQGSRQALKSKEDVENLLRGPLKREVNGLSRRLAGLSIAHDIDINNQSNLEKVKFLEADYNNEELLSKAMGQLEQLKLLILPGSFQESVLCMEAAYNLDPIINPFSDLRHNNISLGKSTVEQKNLMKKLRPGLKRLMSVDMKLWEHLEKLFQKQKDLYGVKSEEVRVRELIHREALIQPAWLNEPGMTDELLLKGLAGRVAQRAVEAGELGPLLVSTVCRWPRLDREAAKEIKTLAMSSWEKKR